MKVKISVILFLAALVSAHCAPAEKKDDKVANADKEIDIVPLEGRQPGPGFPPGGIVDIDAGGPGFFGNPFAGSPFVGNPFPSLLNSIEAMMTKMRQQLSQILGSLPSKPQGSLFPDFNFGNFGDVDLGKGNTTSVTKVIDGHVVTINETEYKQDGNNSASFYKVRIIDVHPNPDDASTEQYPEAIIPSHTRDREEIDESVNNEIPKANEELRDDNIESFGEVDFPSSPFKWTHGRRKQDIDNSKSVESIEENSIDGESVPIDLSNDIYVNQLMADAGAQPDPDAEMFDVVGGKNVLPLNYGYPAGSIPRNSPRSDFERYSLQHSPVPQHFYYPSPVYTISNEEKQQFVRPQQIPAHPYNQVYIPRFDSNVGNYQGHSVPSSQNSVPEEFVRNPQTYSST